MANEALHHCWNCEYDVADQLARREYTCPECGSRIDKLRRRMAVHHGRRHLRDAKLSGVVGVVLVGIAHLLTNEFGTPMGVGLWVLSGAGMALVFAIHKLDRTTWRLGGSGPLVWMMRLIGPVVAGVCLTGGLFVSVLIVRMVFGDLRLW